MRPLPIDPLLPQVVEALRQGSRLILRAAPGAGKTTRVPAAILDAGLAEGKEVVVLEPRRIAARAAAEFVAGERGGRVGEEVGYRVRFESRGGTATRLWFVTEGVLTRSLARDPFLESAGVIVLDEFHERHLQGDVLLGVARELQATVRPDLKLVVMSATLETEALARHLGGCPVLTSEGRSFPIDIAYAGGGNERSLAGRVAAAVERLVGEEEGDLLVFLPGAAEIRRVSEALEALAARQDLLLVPLHGDLPLEAQRRALAPAERRKVVLATNVAETALTIEGVTAVVDSGLAREARFDARHGVNRLEVVTISHAAADQRAGRAGRTSAGRCIRLWSRAEHDGRRERETPEVLRLDLSATVLELRAWGVREVGRFPWLDPPPASALDGAERLLRLLGAVDPVSGAPTDLGRRMLELPVPPRLARVLIEAERSGVAAEGAALAALASERDICLERRALGPRSDAPWPAGPSDLLLRLELLGEVTARGRGRGRSAALGLDERTVRTVERARQRLASLVRTGGVARPGGDSETLLRCVLAGFPDRVVRRRERGSPRGVMVGGVGVFLDAASVVRDAELFVAVDVEGAIRREHAEARVRLASAVRREWLEDMFPASIREERELHFDPVGERVVERRRELYVDLVLGEETRTDVEALRAGEILAGEARRDPERALGLGGAEGDLLGRLAFLARAMPEAGLPADARGLLADVATDLAQGRRSFTELRSADVGAAIRRRLTAAARALLDRDAPEEIRLPSGRAARIRYEAEKPPLVAARIQELFGLGRTPRLAAGRVPLVIEILAPNQRPVQVTDDLESFWRRTYPEVRKQLRGRYPKHVWPEDPFSEPPTSRVKRR